MSNIICPRPYTTSNEPDAIPCGITYADAIGFNKFQALRILAISFCFPLLIITIIQCIRLIYYRGLHPFVQIHAMYVFVFLSVASQAIRSIDPQGWSVLLDPGANQILGDISACAILCIAFVVAMSWLQLMRRISGKRESKIYQHAEWIMPCGLFIITLALSILQTQVHNPGTYVFTVAKYSVFIVFVASFTIALWTQGIPLYITLNQSNGVSGSSSRCSKADRDAPKMHMAAIASPSSPQKTLQSQPSSSAIDIHLIRQPSLPVVGINPHQVNIEMNDMESTTYGDRSSFTTHYTHHTYSSKPSIFPDHIQLVRTSINQSNPASAASSPSMAYGTRTISTPSASRAPAHMMIPSTPTSAACAPISRMPIVTTTPAPSSHSSVGKKKAKMTRILKLIVAASCVSLAGIGFWIFRIVGDYTSKFDDRERPRPVPVGTFGSIFTNILLGILEYSACIVILSFFRQMRGDGGNAYSDTPQKQSKQTNTYTQQARTVAS